jgi:hypothetical protein
MVAPVRPCSPRPDAPTSRQLPAARRIGTRSGASSADLGPHWVLVRTDAHGRRRSPAVAKGSEESQVAAGPAQAAGRMRAGDSDCGPDGHAVAVRSSRGRNVLQAVALLGPGIGRWPSVIGNEDTP